MTRLVLAASILRRLRVACTVVVATLVITLTPAVQAGALSAEALGVYAGGGAVARHEAFDTWLGRRAPIAMDFLDQGAGWQGIAQPLWVLDTWGPWVRAEGGRRLVLSVPLLPSSAWGQLWAGGAGYFDEPFWWLAKAMVDRGLGNSVIRLGWEANTLGHPWAAEGDPTSYKQFFRRVVAVMRSLPGAAFTFDWTANSGVGGGSALTTFESFYPGDDVVDTIGTDVYDIKWQDATSSPAERWNFLLYRRLGLVDHLNFARAHGKQVSFPEWAMYARGNQYGGGGDSPYFVERMADWFNWVRPAYQSYFDVDWGGGTMSSFPNGRYLYKARFGAAGY